jgi:outer membrane lipoprotein-sorting protein
MQNQTVVVSRSLALVLLAGGTLWAQSAQQELNRAIENLERRTITGKPYSATAVTTSTQTLSDGTKITRTVQVSLARDSEGRTRREQSVSSVGPWSTNAKENFVSINDPVAQVRYVLQPDGQTAVKVSLGNMSAKMDELKRTLADAEKKRAAEAKVSGQSEAERKNSAKAEAELKARTEKLASLILTVGRDGGNVGIAFTAEGDRKAQVDDLGVKSIENVSAKGRRETQTIPIGQIGNDRPIQILSETWYSDDLQTIVYSKHSDPRVGDSEYRLTNISRAEPARSLFEVPAGYTVKEEGREPRRE